MSKLLYICCLLILPLSAQANKFDSDKPLSERAVKEIMSNYSFIADFNSYDETRKVGDEVFWRYPSKLPRPKFELEVNLDIDDPMFKDQVPVTYGSSRVEEHINAGRVEFLKGNYEEAVEIWTAGHRRYLKKNSLSKRYSYFLGLAMLSEAKKKLDNGASWDSVDMKALLFSVTTLYSKAFGLKEDLKDDKIDKFKARAMYNQAVIYYHYKRYPLALGIANKAVRYQQQKGIMENQSVLRRIIAEVYIDAKEYLDAIRQYDISIRQSEKPTEAAYMFARAGDIYFSLNNFELAEDMYRLAIRISRKKDILDPAQYILRGESLFWMGKFKDSQLMLNYGLMASSSPKLDYETEDDLLAMAHIRIADASLALGEYKKARLRYFQHIEQFRAKPTAAYARLRLACLELPFYEGNNILHARELLEKYKTSDDQLNQDAIEIAWTCEMASYAKTDRNPDLVDRVRQFYKKYPNSKLLKSLIEPVREVQSEVIDELIENKKYAETIDLYEKSKDSIYTVLNKSRKIGLFEAYVALYQSNKSKPFIRDYYESISSDKEKLYFLVGYAESSEGLDSQIISNNYKLLREQLKDEPLDLKKTTDNRLLLKRLLSADRSNLEWISEVYMNWGIDDLSEYCGEIYSLLVKNKDEQAYKKYIHKTIVYILDSRFDRFLMEDKTCAKNYLGLFMLISPNTEVYSFIEARTEIPYDNDFVPLIWSFANELINNDMKKQGQQLLKKIMANVTEENKYYRFSKAKLETFQSRYNNIWE